MISRIRRKEVHEELNAVEMFNFRSVNGCLSWIGSIASPFSAFYNSHLQQFKGSATVHDMVLRANFLKIVQRLGSVTTFIRASVPGKYDLSICLHADAARPSTKRQLAFIGAVLIGPSQSGLEYMCLYYL